MLKAGGADAGSSLATAGASSALTSLPTATTTVTTTAASTKPTKPATSLHTDIQMSLKPANTRDLLIAHRGAASSLPAGKKAMSWPNNGTDIWAGTVAGPRRNAFKRGSMECTAKRHGH